MNIIFDFDGTIADSFEYVLEFLTQQAKRKLPLTDGERETLQGIPMATMARWLRVSFWRLPLLFWRGRSAMGQRISEVHPFPGLKEVIANLHKDGHSLFIVSSNSVQNIQKFLENNGMNTEFTKIYGKAGLSKSRILRKLMRRHQLISIETLYIADEARDIDAARKAKIDTIAVAWGYSNEVVMAEHDPLVIVKRPSEILEAVREIDAKQ